MNQPQKKQVLVVLDPELNLVAIVAKQALPDVNVFLSVATALPSVNLQLNHSDLADVQMVVEDVKPTSQTNTLKAYAKAGEAISFRRKNILLIVKNYVSRECKTEVSVV